MRTSLAFASIVQTVAGQYTAVSMQCCAGWRLFQPVCLYHHLVVRPCRAGVRCDWQGQSSSPSSAVSLCAFLHVYHTVCCVDYRYHGCSSFACPGETRHEQLCFHHMSQHVLSSGHSCVPQSDMLGSALTPCCIGWCSPMSLCSGTHGVRTRRCMLSCLPAVPWTPTCKLPSLRARARGT